MALTTADALPVEVDTAGLGLEQAGDRTKGGGLTRTIRADESDDLTFVHGQAQTLDRCDIAVVNREIVDIEHQLPGTGHGGICRCHRALPSVPVRPR